MRKGMKVLGYAHLMAALAFVVAPAPAAAQQSPFTIGTLILGWMDAGSNVDQSCQTTSQLYSSPNDGTLHCAGPGIAGDGRWSTAFGGPLRIQVSVSAVDAPAYYATMDGQSYFNDFLNFTGPSIPSAVRFTLHESGSISGNPEVTEAPLSLQSSLTGFGGAFCNGADQASTVTYYATFNTSRSALCTFSGNSLNFGYSLFAAASIDVGRINGNLAPPLLNGAASVDVWNTGLIEGLSFYDANGSDITGAVQFTSASGAAYPAAAVTPTPEPTSLTLLMTGLVGICGAARRRRKTQTK